jgi:sulfate transport system permease protein
MSARRAVLPGFGLSFGTTLLYASLFLLLPLAALTARAFSLDPATLVRAVSDPRTLAAFRVSFVCAAIAAAVNTLLGLVTAWVLERYEFPGRRFLDALIDLPFAIPTAVAGITLAALYGPNGAIGAPLLSLGIRVAYTEAGIVIALLFVTLPFAVRTIQPVVQGLDREVEAAAHSLGASSWTTFTKVVLPELRPALVTGFALAFARAIGEYGSIIFIAGNLPMETEIAPLLIMIRLEQFDYPGAIAISIAYLVAGIALLLFVHWSHARQMRPLEQR